MKVFGLNIPDAKGLTNVELENYTQKLGINNFRGVFMRDTLPHRRISSRMWNCQFKHIKRIRKSLGVLL